MKITNEADVSLPLAVWLLSDDYDYIDGVDNYISVTTLMKPVRQIVLPGRIPASERTADVAEFIARKTGHAFHDSIEKAWKDPDQRARALRLLGYNDELIGRIAVNPTDEELRASNSIIPVYLEQRTLKQFEGWTIGGKFDMVADGIVQDFKSTSVWSWIKGNKDDDYRLQGSLYRWLNPKKITEDFIRINFIFTDWSKRDLRTPGYPQKRVEYKDIPLLSLKETEQWVRLKLAVINQYFNLPEKELPHCTDTELWRSDPQYRYFADPAKASDPNARSTKNFSDLVEARKFMSEKGGKGTIVTKPGEPKACGYCAAFEACTQKDAYF